ncbi:MAG TPA: tRNA pseudouridine(13) synthase TruD [Gemmataceae bacterium]|nr:tRNA pseudouridine(13) synthase TruD [Gemmataceae bacterium]
MKIKQRPEDFYVEELTDVQPLSEGEFALYRLEKRGWTTPDAVQVIRQRWKLDGRRISFGGLKDRHAHTIQYLTIWRGPQRQLTHQGIHLQYLGRLSEPYTSHHFRGNRFRLVIRALTETELEPAVTALGEVRRDGVPNYYDDQRFGSVSGGEFVAKALVLGDFERALQLALCAPYEHDRAAQKREKQILRSHWGDWPACQAKLPRGQTLAVIDFLVRQPGDFRGAMVRLRPELGSLYMSAYQSHLWNRMLARWLREHLEPSQLLSGHWPMHRQLNDVQRAELTALQLPLPTARGQVEPTDPRVILMSAILAEDGLTREQMKVKGVRELFFSRGERTALCMPADLTHESGEDECNEGRKKLVLGFDLPRGCYATLIVKRLFGDR